MSQLVQSGGTFSQSCTHCAVSWCGALHHHHLTGFCPKSSVLSTLAPRLIRVSQAACIPAIAARWRGVCFFWKSDLSQRKIFVSENSEYFVKYWYHLVEGGLLLLHIILVSEIQLSFFVTLDSSNFQSSEAFTVEQFLICLFFLHIYVANRS